MLNLYYNYSCYKDLSLTTPFDNPSNIFPKRYGNVVDSVLETPRDEDLVPIIIRYMALYQILSNLEAVSELVEKFTKKCRYCDNDINKDDRRCPVCQEFYGNADESEEAVDDIARVTHSNGGLWLPTDYQSFSKNIKSRGIVDEGSTVTIDYKQEQMNDVWVCPSCTYKNKLENKCCDTCFTIREMDLSFESSEIGDSIENPWSQANTWQCTGCYNDNPFLKYKCVQCHNSAPFFHKWICEKCSFFNEKLSQKCITCGYSNGHLTACSICRKNIFNEKVTKVNNTGYSKFGPLKKSDKQHEYNCKCAIDREITNKNRGCVSQRSTGVMWYCNNKWCASINEQISEYCTYCNLKKNSNVTEYNNVEVFDGRSYAKMWQCPTCKTFNNGYRCLKCSWSWGGLVTSVKELWLSI